jgi:hypothetical protein
MELVTIAAKKSAPHVWRLGRVQFFALIASRCSTAETMPGSLSHLIRRFFDVLVAQPLTVQEEAAVGRMLPTPLLEIFVQQSSADQRHAYDAALSVIAAGVHDNDVQIAALMHDVGKRHSSFGVVGRTIASLLMLVDAPLTKRMARYRDHGRLGAEELDCLGAPQLAVEFARDHHRSRPGTIDQPIWSLLREADESPNAGLRGLPRIFFRQQ